MSFAIMFFSKFKPNVAKTVLNGPRFHILRRIDYCKTHQLNKIVDDRY